MADRLLLQRHGQIEANRNGRWHGSTDSLLTWRGRRQAKRTAKVLKRRNYLFEAIYVSPLQRCRATANPSEKVQGIDAVVHHDLREWSIGAWEDLPFSELASKYDFMTQTRKDPSFTPPGGENLRAVAERVSAALKEIDQSHEGTVLVVSHGACMAAALGILLDNDPTMWRDYLVGNCALTELVLHPAPHVNFFNRDEHV